MVLIHNFLLTVACRKRYLVLKRHFLKYNFGKSVHQSVLGFKKNSQQSRTLVCHLKNSNTHHFCRETTRLLRRWKQQIHTCSPRTFCAIVKASGGVSKDLTRKGRVKNTSDGLIICTLFLIFTTQVYNQYNYKK